MDQRRLHLLTILLAIILSGCGGEKETPTPPPSLTADNVGRSEAASTAQLKPTIAVLSTIERDPAPTVTIGPPATLTPLPTPTRLLVELETADDFGDRFNPLTGEIIEDETVLNRRPLAVKISNAPPQWVRPQAGLNDADLIYEHITEAGITRFTMVLYGKSPARVGPIRSARLIDLELPAMYDAALVYSGSSDGVRQKLLNSDFRSRIIFAYEPGYFRTGEDKPLEHTLYALPNELWETLDSKGLNQRPSFNTFMAFNSISPGGGESASEVVVDYDWTLIRWEYDSDTGRYSRWTDGEPHLDGNSDEQVNVANVVVVFANHIQDPTICEQVINGVCTAYSVEVLLAGSGPAIIFRDGQRFDGTWTRSGRYDMLTFQQLNGDPLPLQVGNSWIQVIPNWYDNPVTVGD